MTTGIQFIPVDGFYTHITNVDVLNGVKYDENVHHTENIVAKVNVIEYISDRRMPIIIVADVNDSSRICDMYWNPSDGRWKMLTEAEEDFEYYWACEDCGKCPEILLDKNCNYNINKEAPTYPDTRWELESEHGTYSFEK